MISSHKSGGEKDLLFTCLVDSFWHEWHVGKLSKCDVDYELDKNTDSMENIKKTHALLIYLLYMKGHAINISKPQVELSYFWCMQKR